MSPNNTNTKPLNELQLVKKLAEGDFNAFDALFKFYHKKLYHFALSLLKNSEDAEDVVQEVFVRIWENRDNIKIRHSFKSFLFTIAYNIIVNQLRKRMADVRFREKLEKNIQTDLTREADHLVYMELDNRFRTVLSQLPPQRKRIYKMHRDLKMTYKEIGQKLNISPNTVRNQFSEALKFLQEQMKSDSLLILLFIKLFI